MPMVEIKSLTYTYPGRTNPSIRDASLTIEKGEFVILTGPSGCGKTTLCRCLNGLIPHFYGGQLSGDLEVAGLKVLKHPIYEMAKHVGFVFQNPENQLFALSVEKDVAFGLENLGIPRGDMQKLVDWSLQMTGITNLRERAPHELSGGQQQRVAISCVLAMKPDVMVLDEPTSFLDPIGAQKIFRVINELNKKLGITVILVEHRLDFASQYANHVIVMNKGRIILNGPPSAVFNSETTRLVGIGIPRATRLWQILQENGLKSSEIPTSSEEFTELMRKVLKK